MKQPKINKLWGKKKVGREAWPNWENRALIFVRTRETLIIMPQMPVTHLLSEDLVKRQLAFEAQGHRAPGGVTATPGKLQDSDLCVK